MRLPAIYFALALLGGPVIAFLVIAAGCAQPWQLFGVRGHL